MTQLSQTLEISSSPQISGVASTDRIMWAVVVALMPTTLYASFLFGWAGLVTLVFATAACVLMEHLCCRLTRHRTTIGDGSAAVTGLLFGLTLPPGLPLWMTVLGGAFAIGIGKLLFGGLGSNCFNPALVGRAFLQAAFPTAMTTWLAHDSQRLTSLPGSLLAWPLCQPQYDGVSAATPLTKWKFDHEAASSIDLFLGSTAGSIGETSAAMILLGGVYLVIRRMMNWRIPVTILTTVAGLSAALHWVDSAHYASPQFMLFSGGLMLGAVFMATDMVASPMTHKGCVLYGALIGAMIVLIRSWGGMPEGVMYAILLGNALSPHIDNWIQPRVYGSVSRIAPTVAAASTTAQPIAQPMSHPAAQAVVHAKPVAADAVDTNLAVAAPAGSSLVTVDRNRPAGSVEVQIFTVLLVVGVVCSLAIVSAYLATAPAIARNQIAQRQRAVLAVLPSAIQAQAFQLTADGHFQPVPMQTTGAEVVFAGYDQQQKLVGLAMLGQSAGYQDMVQIAYGYSLDKQTILGFEVLFSRETPGIGDRVPQDAGFLKNFQQLDVRLTADGDRLENVIQYVKPGEKTANWQVDGVSGATITSKAITRILSEGSAYWIPRLWQRRVDFEYSQAGSVHE
ncbi:MAG: RnfABCDGE type electron transport complex subunit D [Pirellulaceae bacterium]|nr:RnfABCDGE type electron transport complex subunit D [Pirellulaceae bacterium]